MTVDRTVPEVHLHIGDERRATGGGGVHEHVYPGHRRGPGSRAARRRRGHRRCRAGRTARRSRLADMDAVAAARRAGPARRPARRSPRRAGPAVGARQRHDLGIAHFTATSVVDYTRYYAGWADKIEGRVTSSPAHGRELAYTAPEPYGVVGIIITWNGPLVSVGMKVIPALAAGNTVVVKPSELTPYATEHFMDARPRGRHPGRCRQRAAGHGRGRRGAGPPPARAEGQLHRRADGRARDPRRRAPRR